MTSEQTFVVVGASLTAAKTAQRLRKDGFAGRVILVGAERERPYERPPLSKGYLLGKEERDSIYVHEESWYADNSVELLLGRRAVRLDVGAHEVELADGERLAYTKVLLATGSSPRKLRLPGTDLDGVHYLRTVGNSERLRDTIRAGGRVVVVGGGWIGLETAAAARQHGCDVTIVEPQAAPLRAALGDRLGGFFADVHRAQGVDVRLDTTVTEVRGSSGRVSAVVTGDGTELAADAVVIGVGVEPRTELAGDAGLAVDDGVVVDAGLRTEQPDVYAAGDVARSHYPRYGRGLRVEHWANAVRSAPVAARSMMGEQVAYDRVPYFFSDQYDVGMEFSGWFAPDGFDDIVVRGDVEAKAFQAFWLAGGRVVAGLHVNRWDDGVKPIEKLITGGTAVDPGQLADPSVALADLAGD
ncbi:MAG: NAD(P)/FAD-dependent oxidoreductase [Streptosporangiales bacterium]|nr:NAD(P)/FAD-dependent oxidoreductase [Streptosporangiales bacterium]